MLSSVEAKISQVEASIEFLRALEPGYRETANVVCGQDSFENATWIERDELIAQAKQRLEYYRAMLGSFRTESNSQSV